MYHAMLSVQVPELVVQVPELVPRLRNFTSMAGGWKPAKRSIIYIVGAQVYLKTTNLPQAHAEGQCKPFRRISLT
jgi:hypothetical protein